MIVLASKSLARTAVLRAAGHRVRARAAAADRQGQRAVVVDPPAGHVGRTAAAERIGHACGGQLRGVRAALEAQTKQRVALIDQTGQEMSEEMEAGDEIPERPEPEPERPSRKVITIQAPSGAVYTGVIEEQSGD